MATILNLGVPGTQPGYLHPKQSHKYIMTFQGIGGGSDSQALTRQCVSTNKPSYSQNEVQLHRYNTTAFIAGKYNWEPLDLVIEDDISNAAAIVLQEQWNKQINLTTNAAVPLGLDAAVSGGAYKFNSQLLITLGDGADNGEPTVIERWTMQGCWFTNVAHGDLSWESDDPTQITVNMRFDTAFCEYTNSASPASALVGE